MPRSVLSGSAGELVIECEAIPVWYLSDIDGGWRFTDAAGHLHHCEYDAADHYPTLTRVVEETYWCENCGDEHEASRLECRQCGEAIAPGTTGPGVKYVSGITTFTLNGEPVSREEAQRVVAEWPGCRG